MPGCASGARTILPTAMYGGCAGTGTTRKPVLQAELLAGTFRLNPLRCVRHAEGATLLLSAQDALVTRAAAKVLSRAVAPHLGSTCHHLPGRGGLKGAG